MHIRRICVFVEITIMSEDIRRAQSLLLACTRFTIAFDVLHQLSIFLRTTNISLFNNKSEQNETCYYAVKSIYHIQFINKTYSAFIHTHTHCWVNTQKMYELRRAHTHAAEIYIFAYNQWKLACSLNRSGLIIH